MNIFSLWRWIISFKNQFCDVSTGNNAWNYMCFKTRRNCHTVCTTFNPTLFLKVTLILKKSIIVFFGTLRVILSESSLDFPVNPNNLLVTSYNRKFIELLNHNARTYLYSFVKTIKLIEDLFLFTFLHEWLRAVGLLFA